MVSNIDKKDVIRVAESLMITLTENQINEVLHMYPHEEECDPSSTWIEIVENCIYNIL
jgi:hypothetical protein